MRYKIAIASTDGKVINQHFGRADSFYIIEADSDTLTYEYKETRKSGPVCEGGDHDDHQLEETAKQLADCQYVLVSRIGYRAQITLEVMGIEVFELPGIIEESVYRLLKYIKIQHLYNRNNGSEMIYR